MSLGECPKYWLFRKNELNLFSISTVLSSESILDFLKNGEFSADDEICPENGYWFAVHEMEELKRFFTISSPELKFKQKSKDLEDTTEVTLPGTKIIATEAKPTMQSATVSTTNVEENSVGKKSALIFLFYFGVLCALMGVLWVLHTLRQ